MLSGIPETKYDSLLKKEPRPIDGLEIIYHGSWDKASSVYSLVPKTVWDMYEATGQKGLREQVMLDNALKHLNQQLKKVIYQ